MSQTFLLNQKHILQSVLSNSQTNDSYELILEASHKHTVVGMSMKSNLQIFCELIRLVNFYTILCIILNI